MNIEIIVLIAFGLGFVAVANQLSKIEARIYDLESKFDENEEDN